jgi:hypothetical protein
MTHHRTISRWFIAIVGISLGLALWHLPVYAEPGQPPIWERPAWKMPGKALDKLPGVQAWVEAHHWSGKSVKPSYGRSVGKNTRYSASTPQKE